MQNGSTDKVQKLLQAIKDGKSVLILTHNNPDPDSLAAAYGLRHLLLHAAKIRSTIGYGGIIGRAENRAMVRLLRIPIVHFSKLKTKDFGAIALCDSQPASKNHEVWMGRKPDIVLDHHPAHRRVGSVKFADVRTHYGATSTIITEYIQQMDAPLNAKVATALYYGIKTDISDLARKKSEEDLKALRFLYPKISARWLYRIERPRVCSDYFVVFAHAIHNARIYKDAVVTHLSHTPQTDYVAELSDNMLRLEGMKWSFCIGCNNEGDAVFSVRTIKRNKDAGAIAQNILPRSKDASGGGHNMSAGGRYAIGNDTDEKRIEICQTAIKRFLEELGYDQIAGEPLGEKARLSLPCES